MNTQTFYIVLCTVVLPFAAAGQRQHHLGLVAGLNQSSLRSDFLQIADARTSWTAGLNYLIPLGPQLDYQQELLYAREGASAKVLVSGSESGPREGRYNFFYTTLGTTGLLSWKPAKRTPLYLEGGGFFATYANRLERSVPGVVLLDNPDFYLATPVHKVSPAFGGIDYGPVAGVGVGNDRVRLSVRYRWGMKNLYDNVDFVPHVYSIRTQAVRATLTVYL
jgi:hypothetical protein